MPYTHFRYLAWEIPTAVTPIGAGDLVSGFDPGNECPAVQTIAVSNGVDNDARKRLRRLASVVNWTLGRLAAYPNDNATLKIFVLPEFYFRPASSGNGGDTPWGTYITKVATEILGELNSMFTHPDFADWLFVCGTVMWNTSSDPKAGILYFNTAIWVRGGRENGLSIVEKRLASGIDGIPIAMAPGADASVKRILESWQNRQRHLFDVDGITCGVEVCLDHAQHQRDSVLYPATLKQVLRESSLMAGLLGEQPPLLRLHILPAGGMPILGQSVAATPGGYILRNDGITNQGNRSELCEITQYQKADGTVSNNFEPSADSTAVMQPHNPVARINVPPGPMQIPIPKGYNGFNQCVAFYDRKPAV